MKLTLQDRSPFLISIFRFSSSIGAPLSLGITVQEISMLFLKSITSGEVSVKLYLTWTLREKFTSQNLTKFHRTCQKAHFTTFSVQGHPCDLKTVLRVQFPSVNFFIVVDHQKNNAAFSLNYIFFFFYSLFPSAKCYSIKNMRKEKSLQIRKLSKDKILSLHN